MTTDLKPVHPQTSTSPASTSDPKLASIWLGWGGKNASVVADAVLCCVAWHGVKGAQFVRGWKSRVATSG